MKQKPILSIYKLIGDSAGTKLACNLFDFLEIVSISESENKPSTYFSPSAEQLFKDVISQCSDEITLAHEINKYFINVVKRTLIGLMDSKHQIVIERLLTIKKQLNTRDPRMDNCEFEFLNISATDADQDSLIGLYSAIKDYCEKFVISNINTNVTFSFYISSEGLKALTDLVPTYIHQTVNKHNSKVNQPSEYLLRLGDMYRDITSGLEFSHFTVKTDGILLTHLDNYEFVINQKPDYLILHVLDDVETKA